jgi:hypothetical protein
MPGMKKAKTKYPSDSGSEEYKDTMMKLKNYWPESTIDLYVSKAISLHDLDNLVENQKQLAEINQVVLNVDEWYKKNPEYLFMSATKLLKEKANIVTPGSSERSLARELYPFRSRTRFEQAMETDQYSRRSPGFDEDMSDEAIIASLDGQEVQGINIPMPQDPPVERPRTPRAQTVRASYTSGFGTMSPEETNSRWDTLFGGQAQQSAGTFTAETVATNSTSEPAPTFNANIPSGTTLSATPDLATGELHAVIGDANTGTIHSVSYPLADFELMADGMWRRR